MKIKDLWACYLAKIEKANENLIKIAFDEMESKQYEEASIHFDQLYTQDANDFMSYFFRAYCKSHCGTRGNAYPDSQSLTAAFNLSFKKAISAKENLDTNLCLIFSMYEDAMENLYANAVNDAYKIPLDSRTNIVNCIKENVDIIKSTEKTKAFIVNYLKKIVDYNLESYGTLILSFDPSYATILEEKRKKLKRRSIITLTIILAVLLGPIIIAICGA